MAERLLLVVEWLQLAAAVVDSVASVAKEEDQALPVPPALLDSPETQEPQELQDSLASPSKLPANKPPSHPASLAPAANLASPAHLDPLDSLDSPVNLANLEATHSPDPQDRLDHLETPEAPASPEALVSLDNPHNPRRLDLLLLAHQERLVPQASPETLAHLDSPEVLDSPAQRVPLERLDSLATTANPATQDSQDSPEVLERRESAPSTAPSTAESSSRTAPEDVRGEHIRLDIKDLDPYIFFYLFSLCNRTPSKTAIIIRIDRTA